MSERSVSALSTVLERLVMIALESTEFRSALRELAEAILEKTGSHEQEREPTVESLREHISRIAVKPSEVLPPFAGDAVALPETDERVDVSTPLPELTLGRQSILTAAPPISLPAGWTAPADVDLSLVEARCRLKAEGARWAATRRRLMTEGADYSTEVEPQNREIIARARAIQDCFLWMCHPTGPSPADVRLYENIAGCFDAVADTISILKQELDEPELYRGEFENSLDLLAEAQSALRVAIAAIDGPTDLDQMLVFNWLKRTTNENQVFIQRYMRADDPADPANWSELSVRIEVVDSRVQETQQRAKRRRKLVSKVRHKVSLIAENPNNTEDEWRILVTAVDELVNDGLPPSNRELREMLVPIIENLPELPDVPAGFQLVLREIDRFLANSPPPENAPVIQRSDETLEIARRLNGRSMVLIGGERRPASYRAIKEAFGLHELYWLEGREHRPIGDFEPYIAKPDVAVVLLAIRWSSHSFGEVRGFCDHNNKPLVRLPGGYNPNQVAAQIMAQASQRLTEN